MSQKLSDIISITRRGMKPWPWSMLVLHGLKLKQACAKVDMHGLGPVLGSLVIDAADVLTCICI